MERSRSGTHIVATRAFTALAIVTWTLLVFGASVRVHGAGLACPDWPLCFGEVVPQLDFGVFLEWGHRALAGTISVGFLAAGGLVLWKPELRARAGTLVWIAAAALALQVVLGGLTVLHLLAYWSVTLHLLTGNLFFLLLVLIALAVKGAPAPLQAMARAPRLLAMALAVAVLVQMGLGGLVSSNYAGLACTEWPTCNGGMWFPAWEGAIGLQLAHRLGAYTVLALAGAFLYVARSYRAVRPLASAVVVLVLVQAALGIANVHMRLPVEIAIAHSAVADLLVLVTTLAVRATLRHPLATVPRPVPSFGAAEGA